MIGLPELREKTQELRREIIELIYRAEAGHPGGSLSAIDMLATLYFNELNHDPENPEWEDRDRVIISKGHISPAVYSVLANVGYFSKEEYKNYRKLGGMLQGHVVREIPGVELSTGSLGQGLSVANGMAFAGRLSEKDYNIYCMMGDGELQEGSAWEAIMTAGHWKLSNVCCILDYNKIQENGFVNDIKKMEPMKSRWEDFGWNVLETDGHNVRRITKALRKFKKEKKKPTVIISHTIKGKGVSYMENNPGFHGKAPNTELYEKAMIELGGMQDEG